MSPWPLVKFLGKCTSGYGGSSVHSESIPRVRRNWALKSKTSLTTQSVFLCNSQKPKGCYPDDITVFYPRGLFLPPEPNYATTFFFQAENSQRWHILNVFACDPYSRSLIMSLIVSIFCCTAGILKLCTGGGGGCRADWTLTQLLCFPLKFVQCKTVNFLPPESFMWWENVFR